MNDAFGANALAFAVKTKVENFFIWMLTTNFVIGDSAHQHCILISSPL
jgi:hypothetical protein